MTTIHGRGKRTLKLLAAGVASALLAGAPARAQGDGLTPTPDGRYRVGLVSGQVTLVDNAQFRTLIGGSTVAFVNGTALVPSVRLAPKHYGADVSVIITNTTEQNQALGTINIDGVRLPGNSKQWTFAQDTSTRVLTGYTWYNFWVYPNDTYSPVQVIGDDRHTLGFSIQYPIVEYNHAVEVILLGVSQATPWGGDPHWAVQFRLRGEIPPGETRSYTVSIRATTVENSFLNTLVPYRDYFRAMYGPVDYARDSRPVHGKPIAQISAVSPGNPRGYQNPLDRPDLVGWARTVNAIVAARTDGYRRAMVWAPSGCQEHSTGLNYPYRFMTPINDFPMSRDTMGEFQRVRDAGMELGFWWGNNATLMRGWNESVTAEAFDPNNAEHVHLAYLELDMAVRAGATMIGLDAFKQSSPANMFNWLQMMKARAPNVKFVTENAAPDLIHNLAPTFHESEVIRNPHVLADFLHPGHETWAAIATTPESRAENRNATSAEIVREMNRVAALGFVPLVYSRTRIPNSMVAADTSTRTIPRALRTPPPASDRLSAQPARRRFGGGGGG